MKLLFMRTITFVILPPLLKQTTPQFYLHDVAAHWSTILANPFSSLCKIFTVWVEVNSYYKIYICVNFIQGACTESLDSQVQGVTTHPLHPWSLWLVNHNPPGSASSVMIMSHSIDLAGLAHRKNSLTLHCFLT